ncbi:hypothetical protein Syun_010997 [Stephania yunnanensis]|uniref:DELLA protein n=1 Tax=Stephania yunnanensis TaxID=152371 RepID=A0AAP0JWQ7_9MAGN
MGPFDSVGSCSSSSSSDPEKSTTTSVRKSEIDGQLAGAGYKVRLSELRQVAKRLEHLENAMINATDEVSELLESSDTVHYNPTNMASWLDSMLSELTPLPSRTPDLFPDPFAPATWPPMTTQQQLVPVPYSVVVDDEEDSGIRLVHLLMTCAESVQIGDANLADAEDAHASEHVLRNRKGRRLLRRRSFLPPILAADRRGLVGGTAESEILYHHFYEACPYLKFAHFTANQAILESFAGHDAVHVIDFSLMHGLQWPALIQALALRPGGPPLLRLTGIGPPSPDGRDALREIGLRLAELAWSANVPFAFRGVAAARLEDVKPWMLHVNSGEAVAVNSIMQLHKLVGSEAGLVLCWVGSGG